MIAWGTVNTAEANRWPIINLRAANCAALETAARSLGIWDSMKTACVMSRHDTTPAMLCARGDVPCGLLCHDPGSFSSERCDPTSSDFGATDFEKNQASLQFGLCHPHNTDGTAMLCSKGLFAGADCFNQTTEDCVEGIIYPEGQGSVQPDPDPEPEPDPTSSGGACAGANEGWCSSAVGCYDTTTHWCHSDFICLHSEEAGCGRCFVPGALPMNASCDVDAECATGRCSSPWCGAPGGKCVCDKDSDCQAGVERCDKGAIGSMGVNQCKALKANGQSCTAKKQCLSNRCHWGKCKAP